MRYTTPVGCRTRFPVGYFRMRQPLPMLEYDDREPLIKEYSTNMGGVHLSSSREVYFHRLTIPL